MDNMDKKQKIIVIVSSVITSIIIGACVFFVCFNQKRINASKEAVHYSAEEIVIVPQTEITSEKEEEVKPQKPVYWEYIEEDQEQLEQLQEKNNDVVGIIRISETVLNHPIMLSQEDEGFYLRRDMEGKPNSHGTPFLSLDSNLKLNSGKSIIYGHNIRKYTKDVFAELCYYGRGVEDKKGNLLKTGLEYYKEHPIIDIVTDLGTSHYLIFAYYLVDTADTSDVFRYWHIDQMDDMQSYLDYMDEVKKRNWLDVPVETSISDNMIILSSCSVELSGSGTNRMVVMAKRITTDYDYQEVVEKTTEVEKPLLPMKLRGSKIRKEKIEEDSEADDKQDTKKKSETESEAPHE